ncbi:MAG: IspD/TarI family cytidylyltransferase [Deferribacterota bacterium]|nr:IspD/TarI family cytidylyltransferase [Deferribacterota bacterium]
MKIDAIIPAGGLGLRFSNNVKKQFYKVLDREVIYYTVDRLTKSYNFNKIIIGASIKDYETVKYIMALLSINNYFIVEAGNIRQRTVLNCLKESSSDYVLVHDAVRPVVTRKIVEDTVNAAIKYKAALCGLKLRDALKKIDKTTNRVIENLDRSNYILVHTPQVYKKELLLEALMKVEELKKIVYDEAEAFFYIKKDVFFVESAYYNVKITYRDDMPLLEYYLKNIPV